MLHLGCLGLRCVKIKVTLLCTLVRLRQHQPTVHLVVEFTGLHNAYYSKQKQRHHVCVYLGRTVPTGSQPPDAAATMLLSAAVHLHMSCLAGCQQLSPRLSVHVSSGPLKCATECCP
jgi:hypothetical protein